jgi:hypothetical protein
VGVLWGAAVGASVGVSVEASDGAAVGIIVGIMVGTSDGVSEGGCTGGIEGTLVCIVGTLVPGCTFGANKARISANGASVGTFREPANWQCNNSSIKQMNLISILCIRY